jgi:tetratricopeptide (TPR) repeat protein
MRCASVTLVLAALMVLVSAGLAAAPADQPPPDGPLRIEEPAEKPAAKPADTPKPPEPPRKPVPPGAVARAEKQIAELEERLMAVLGDEMDVQVAVNSAEMKARETVKDPAAASDELSKGHLTPQLREYGRIMRACVQQLAAIEAKYAAILGSVRALQRDSAAADFQDRLKILEGRVGPKHRTSQIKVADFLVKAGDTKAAIFAYNTVYQSLGPKDDTERKSVKEKIASTYEKGGDFKNALSNYKTVYESLPDDHRYDDLNLMLRIASLYERTGDFANALQMYQDVQKHIRAGQTVTGLKEAIERCEDKVGSGARRTTTPKTR